MKKAFVIGLALILVLTGCSQPAAVTPAPTAKKSADFSTIYSGELTTLNYLVSNSSAESAAAVNTVDSLVDYDSYGVLQPSLAKSWKKSDDGLVWTFTLREGVQWLTWEGKEYAEVVAQDFVDALKYTFNSKNASKTANIAYKVIKNGSAYYEGKVTDFNQVGVKAKDKYTLEYTLERPVPYFLSMLTYVSFLPVNGKFLSEMGDRFGTDNKNLLYCGAYLIKTFEPQNLREFVKNEKYWDKDKVYINKLTYKYNKEAATLAPELFLRGDIVETSIPAASIDSWVKDPAKKAMIRPGALSKFTYFYALNFEPKMDKQYEPENWKIAVNNANFRKSLFHALDRTAAVLTAEPYEPQRRILNTITPKNFATVNGTDYTQVGDLAKITSGQPFDKAKATGYRDLAKKELEGKATFPVKVMMPYNTGGPDWVNRSQVIEQQVESVLGKEYIDIVPVAYPATNFGNATRRAGNYAILECNWGADYADPESYTDPFLAGTSYNWPEKALGYQEANGKGTYHNLLDAAKAEVKDMTKRYELFAKAEAFLINEAFVIPLFIGGGGFVGSRVVPFTGAYALNGSSYHRFKGQVIAEKPITPEEYNAAQTKWQQERNEALKKAGQ